MEGLIIIALLIAGASFFEIYQIKNITVAYQDPFGKIRGYKFDYAYPARENWMDIQSFENYVAEKKKLSQVKITKMQVKTRWRLRRA